MSNNCVIFSSSANIDPLFDQVLFLAHYDGADGSQNFTDVKGNVATPHGSPKITRAAGKVLMGEASLDMSVPGSYLSYNNVPNLACGPDDFCIEGLISWTTPGTNTSRGVLQISANPGGIVQSVGNTLAINRRQSDDRWEVYAINQGIITGTPTPPINTKTHYALERYNGKLSLYVNGEALFNYADPTNYTGNHLALGCLYTPDHTSYAFHDEVRITRAARYKGNFTPPVGPHGDNS